MINYKNIKLIALDLDETTLNEKGKLTKRTQNAIENAVSKGIYVVIASGRAYTALPVDLLHIKGINYAITSNGTAVYKLPEGKCISAYKLDAASVEKILELREKYTITYECFIDGVAYANSEYIENPPKFGVAERAKEYLQKTRKPVDDIVAFMYDNKVQLDCIDIVVPDIYVRDEIAQLLNNTDSEVYVTSSVPALVEVSYKKAGKAAGLKIVADSLKIALSDCIAFGNADNDIDMLRECGIGVAVKNATPNCLDAADIIASHHNMDGVAQIIEDILKNK